MWCVKCEAARSFLCELYTLWTVRFMIVYVLHVLFQKIVHVRVDDMMTRFCFCPYSAEIKYPFSRLECKRIKCVKMLSAPLILMRHGHW